MPPPSSFLIPKPPTLLRVSESQAISNSSSFISSTSSSSLFDRISNASSGYLTDVSSPFTPSTAEFGSHEGEPSDAPFKEQAAGRDRESLLPSQSRLPQPTKPSLSTRLDRACALGSRSSARSYSQNGTPFVSLIPIPVSKNDVQRYPPVSDSDDTFFDPITILRSRLERGNQTLATRRALEIMDSGGRPRPSVDGGRGAAPVKVVISEPDSIEDWSNDFELGSSSDDVVNVSILFPSSSDRSLLDQVEQDSFSSPILPRFPSTPVLNAVSPISSPCSPFTMLPPKFSVKFPSTPVLNPVSSPFSPCSPFTLGTPALMSTNWENSRSSISTLMAESLPPSPIPSPAAANISLDEEEIARIMQTVISLPNRSLRHHPFSGSPVDVDVDVATVMRIEIASTLVAAAGRRTTGTGNNNNTLVGLGVAMPIIYPPLPPTLFPSSLRELRAVGPALNSRRVFSLRSLGYQPFDDSMFGNIEQTTTASSSSALLSRNAHDGPSELCGLGLGIEIEEESLLYSPLQGCIAPTPLSPLDFDCDDDDAFRVEQKTLSQAHTIKNHYNTTPPPIAFGKALVGLGLGLGILTTEASVESQSLPAEPTPPPTGGHSLVSAAADEPVAEGEVALPQVSEFILQAQKSLNFFEPSGVQKTIELDASQLERHSALYNLEHSSEILLEHIFSHSPPPPPPLPPTTTQFENKKKTEMIDRQPLANLFKKKTRPRPRRHSSKSKRNNNNPSLKMLKKLGLERLAIFQQPHSGRGRDDLDLTSPAIIDPQDDPRSPNLSTLNRVFLSFSSLKPSSCDETTSKPEVAAANNDNNTQIGLGLPSRVVFRRKLRQQQQQHQQVSSSSSYQEIDTAVRCRSRSSSRSDFERPNYSFIVTEPSFGSNNSRVQSVVAVESSNRFLKPNSQFITTERSLYDIVEVPTPPSSTLSSSSSPSPPTPSGTTPSSSRKNQWSSPFIRLNPPQKRKSFTRNQPSSTSTSTSTGSPTTNEDAAAEEVVVAANSNVDPLLLSSAEASPKDATTTSRPVGFKRYISKFRDLLSFKRSSRSMKKTSDDSSVLLLTSPILIERSEAELLQRQDSNRHHRHHHGDGGVVEEHSLTSSISSHNLQLLF